MKKSAGTIREDADTDRVHFLSIAFMTPVAIYLGWRLGTLNGIFNILMHIIRLFSMVGR